MNPARRLIVPGLALALLGLPPAHAQTPTAPASPDASAPAVSADVSRLIAQAQADRKAGKFSDALALLNAPPPASSPADAKGLQLAVADVQFAWAEELLTNSPAQALPHCQAALAIDQHLRPAHRAVDFNKIGNAYSGLSQNALAIGCYTRSLLLYREAGDRQGEAGALMNLGNVYDDLGQHVKAIRLYRQALPFFQRDGNQESQAMLLMNLGLAHNRLNHHAEALNFYRQAQPLLRRQGNERERGLLLLNMAAAYDGLGQYKKGVGSYQRALPLLQESGDRHAEAIARSNLAIARKHL